MEHGTDKMVTSPGQLHRLCRRRTPDVTFSFDGVAMHAQEGDSLLCAITTLASHLRVHEFDGRPRAGFCGMGVCQDCWVWIEGGHRVRACTTQVREGLRVTTRGPLLPGMGAETSA